MGGWMDGWKGPVRTGQDRDQEKEEEEKEKEEEEKEKEEKKNVCQSVWRASKQTRSQKHSPITIAIITKITIMGAVPGVLSIHTYIHLTQVTLPNLTYLTFLTLLDLTYLTY